MKAKIRFLNFFRNVFKIRILENWLVKRTVGKYPDLLMCKLAPNPYQYKHPTFRNFTRNGINLKVDISDYTGYYIYFGFKDAGIEKLFSLCKQGYNIIDVGTNIGFVLLNFANISKTGKVIGFEPDKYNRDRCLENISLNNSNAIVLPYGLGEREDTFKMEVRTPSNRGGNRITTNLNGQVFEVLVKRMDDLAEIKALSSVDVVKIDVEGYELKVLKGGLNTLVNFKPLLFIELDDNNLKDQGDSAKQLISFLNQNGYNNIKNAANGRVINSEQDFTNCHMDIIAYHES